MPGNKEVRTTWYSDVLGFSSTIAVVPSSLRFKDAKFSSCEHCERLNGVSVIRGHNTTLLSSRLARCD